jgi:hypothetical protein
MVEAVFAHPMELRPLTLKNTANKIIAGVLNWIVHPVVRATACSIQRGFIQGRQLVQNVLDLDFSARRDSLLFSAQKNHKLGFFADLSISKVGVLNTLPVLLLFDFAAAFPSVKHAWMFYLLETIRMPLGLKNAVKKLYEANQGYMDCEGEDYWLFEVMSGVLQGCPLSGSLFVICIDPLLYLFQKHIESPGLGSVRACADDIGVSLRSLISCEVIANLFRDFQGLSNLNLKPKKCVMILTSIVASDHNKKVIKEWLRRYCPLWQEFHLTNCGKYLGFQMGPQAGSVQWVAALSKCKARVLEIKGSSPPLGLLPAQFASRATPVLGYLGQFAQLPVGMKKFELWAAHKALGMTLSLDTEAIFDLGHFGGAKLVRMSNYLRSCSCRAALTTVTGYDEMHFELGDAAFLGAPLQDIVQRKYRPQGWDSDAFASNLFRAKRGLGLGLDDHAHEISALFNKLSSGNDPQNQGTSRRGRQGTFYDLFQTFCKSDWKDTLDRKLRFVGPILPVDWTLSPSIDNSVAVACKKAGIRIATAAVKTWANAWCTSSRLHESEVCMRCLFGCDAKDELSHYLICDPLWTCVISCSYRRTELLYRDPFERLGLVSPHYEWLRMLAIAFSAYHSIKFKHTHEVQNIQDGGNPCQVHLILIQYCRAFALDIT